MDREEVAFHGNKDLPRLHLEGTLKKYTSDVWPHAT